MILTRNVIGFTTTYPGCEIVWRLMGDGSVPGLYHRTPHWGGWRNSAERLLHGIEGVGGVIFPAPAEAFIFVKTGADTIALEKELERVASGRKPEEVQ